MATVTADTKNNNELNNNKDNINSTLLTYSRARITTEPTLPLISNQDLFQLNTLFYHTSKINCITNQDKTLTVLNDHNTYKKCAISQ